MHKHHFAGHTGENPDLARLNSLKEFHSAGRGFWADVPESDWNDWRWQLKHRITTAGTIAAPHAHADAGGICRHDAGQSPSWPWPSRPYFFNLIDPADENCPIRWQVIPRVEETHTAPVGDERPVRRRLPFARAGTGASLSGPRAVPGDRPVRGLLPLLHPLAPGQQRHRLRFPSRVRPADRIHPPTPAKCATCC